MPPKPVTRNAKAAGEEPQAQANDPLALMQEMLDVMQRQIQKRDDEIQKRDEQLQKRDEQMLELMDKIANGTTLRANEHNDRDERDDAVRYNRTRSKKVDTPMLGPVDSVSMADYRTWRESFEGYSNVLKLQTECDLTGRRTMLRQALDPSWAKLWTTGMLNVKQTDDVTDILNLIRAYLRKQRSPLLDRRDFHCRNQQPHEKVDQYYAELTMCYDSCDFGDDDLTCADCRVPCGHGQRLREERLRDRLIFGLYSEKIRQKVLEEPFETLTLERTHQIVQAMESSQLTSEDLQKQNVSVDKVKSRNKSAYKQGKFEQNREAVPKRDCYRCGRQRHKMDMDCPAYDAQCHNCQKIGHYEKCCRRPRQEVSMTEVNKKSLQTVRVAELHKMNDTRPRLQLSTRIGKSKHDIMWLCDTGAEVSVIGLNHLKTFEGYKKRKSDVTLYGATDDELGELGRVVGILQYGDIVLETDIYVVKILPMPILSHGELRKLGVLHEQWPHVNALSLDKKECHREVAVGKTIEKGKPTDHPVSAPDETELVGKKEIEGICMQQLNLNAVAMSSLKRETGIMDLNVTRVKQEIDKDPTMTNDIRQRQGCPACAENKADKKAHLLKEKAKTRYDQGAKEMNKLTIGDIVRVQHQVTKRWDLVAEVTGIKERWRSYQVKSETGRLYWRNRRFLRPYNPVIANHNVPYFQTSSPEKVDKSLPHRSKRLEEKRLRVKNRRRYSCT